MRQGLDLRCCLPSGVLHIGSGKIVYGSSCLGVWEYASSKLQTPTTTTLPTKHQHGEIMLSLAGKGHLGPGDLWQVGSAAFPPPELTRCSSAPKCKWACRHFWKAFVFRKREEKKQCGCRNSGPAALREPEEKAAFCPTSHLQHLHDFCTSAGASHRSYLNAFVSLWTDVVQSCLYAPTVEVSVHLQDGWEREKVAT